MSDYRLDRYEKNSVIINFWNCYVLDVAIKIKFNRYFKDIRIYLYSLIRIDVIIELVHNNKR